MGCSNVIDTLYSNKHRCGNKHKTNYNSGYWFGLAMTVRVIIIRRTRSSAKSYPNKERTQYI